jgi:hypothetical protein
MGAYQWVIYPSSGQHQPLAIVVFPVRLESIALYKGIGVKRFEEFHKDQYKANSVKIKEAVSNLL